MFLDNPFNLSFLTIAVFWEEENRNGSYTFKSVSKLTAQSMLFRFALSSDQDYQAEFDVYYVSHSSL